MMSIKKSIYIVLLWIGLALVFNIGIYIYMGPDKALEFLGGYIIEQSLSIDNLFLFLLIFSSFGIKPMYQKRVLNYGIIGAFILRLIFIMVGVVMIEKFHWILYVFGGILVFSGIKMALEKEEGDKKKDFNNSFIIKILKKIMPVSDTLEGEKFFVKKNNILYATPLLAVLLVIEASDVVFAIDSIPAIFSITTDTFIIYTSNIFAIMTLRSMYIVLERIHNLFRYVKYGVAVILAFTGMKLLLLMVPFEISTILSVAIILTILIISIVASLVFKTKETV